MDELTRDEAYDTLVNFGIATTDEIALVESINGISLETLESILYSRAGYRSFDQVYQEM